MPFCNRCNTSLENYMKFCWNCGAPVQQQQGFHAPPQQQVPAQYGYQQSGQRTTTYTVSTPGSPYGQSVTVSYSGSGGPGPAYPPTAGGRKMVTLTCPFCEGEGQHPMNFDQPCPVCRGAGKFTVYEPYTQCQHCEGSGKKFATMDELCPACRGRGVIQL